METVGAALFGWLLDDLKIYYSPHGFRGSFLSWWSDESIDRVRSRPWPTRTILG